MIDDLRSQLRVVEGWGDVLSVREEVSPAFEIAAVCKEKEAGKALLFERVRGYGMPVLVGLDNRRSRIAKVLGTDDRGFTARYLEAIRHPSPPSVVPDGPVKEVVFLEKIDLLAQLPVVTHYEKDGGPFITAGIVIAEDPDRGLRNLSYHRLQVLGKDEIGMHVQQRHLWNLYVQREKQGKALEAAIVIGLDVGIRLAAATSGVMIPLGLDELAIAGALRRRPVEIVAGETVRVMVPARAEIVIEGNILPHIRRRQGPLTDFTGTYGEPWEGPVFKVKAITHRKAPIYQDLLPCSPEHHLLLSLPSETVLFQTIKDAIPGTRAVHVSPAGAGRFHLVVSLAKQDEADGKKAIRTALQCGKDVKMAVAVDDDVNPFNPREVELAVATRFQADRDLVVITGAEGNALDPSSPQRGMTAKMGLDATMPLENRERFRLAKIPGSGTPAPG